MSNEYPKNLFKDGSGFEWEGRSYDGLIVHSKEEEAEAVKAGWRANPFAEAVKAGWRANPFAEAVKAVRKK